MSINTSSPIPSSKGIQQVPAVVSYDRVQVGAITNVLVSIGSFFDRNPQLKNTPYLQKNYEQIKFVLAAAQSTLQTGVGTPNFAYAFEAMQQIMFWLANDENKYYPQALDFYNNIIIPMQNNVMVFRGENNQKIRMIDEANTGTTGIQYAKLYGTNMFVKAKWLEYTTLQLDVKKLRKAIIERDGTDREKAKLAYGAKIRQVLSNFRNVKNILKAQINSIAPLNGVDQWAKKQKVDLENLVTSYLELMGINIDGEITMSGLKIFLNCTDNEAYQIFLECGYQKGYPRLLLPDEVKKYESGVFAYLSLCKELRTESGLLSGVSSQLATNVENDQSIYLQASQQNNTQVRQYFGQYERTLSSIAASLSVIRTQSGTNYQRALVQIKEKRTQLNEVRKEIQIFSRLLKPGSAELSKGNSNDAYINDLVNRLRHPVAIVGKPDSYEEVGTYEAKNVVDAHLFSINKMIADVDESIENYNRTIQEQTYIKDVQLHMRNMSDIVRTVRREQEDASLIPKAISEARLATNAVNALEAFNLENKRKKHENPDITAYIKEMRLGHLLSSVSNIGCALVESHKYAMCSPVGAEADFQKIYTKLQANLEVIFSSDRADLLPYQKKMIADQMILQLANLYKDNAKYPEARFLFNLIISGKSENLPTDKDIRHIAEAYLNLGCSVTDADTIAQAENATGNIDFQDFDYTPANRHFEEAQNELIHAGVVDASGKFQHIEDLEENPWKVEAYTFLQLDRLRNDLYRKENIDIDQLLGQLTLLENTLKQVITQGKERVQQQAKLMLIETNLRRAELLSLQCKYKDVLSLVDPILQDSSIKGRVKSGFLRIKGFALNGLGEHIEAKDFFKSIYDNTHTLQFNEFKIDAAYGYFSAKLNNKEEINLKEIDVWLPLKLSRPEQNLLIEKSVKPPSLMTIEDTVQLRIIQKCLLLLATIWLDMGDYSSAMTAIDQLDKMKLSPWDKADLNSLRTKIYVAKENIPAAKSSQELSKKNFLSWDDKITQFENATEISLYEEPFSLETTNNKFEAFISEITPHINSNQADRFLNDYVNYLIKTLQYKEAGELQDLMAGKPSPASASSLSKAMGTFIGIHFKDTTTIPKPVQDKLARTRSIIQNAEIPPNIQGKELSDALSAYISTTIDAAKCDPQNSSDKLIIIESRLAHISRLQQAQLRQDAINELLSLIDFVRGDDKKDLTELTHNTKRILFNCYSILVKLYIGGEDFSKASNIVKNQMPIVSVDEKNVFQRRLLLSQIDLKKENEPSELRFKPDDLPLIQQNELKFRELFDLYQSGIVEVSASALKEAFNQLKPIQKMSFQRELESMGPEIRSIYPKSATDATYLDALMTQFSSKELQKLTPVLAQQRILDTLQKMDVASSKNKVSAFEGYKYQLYNALIEIYRTGKPKQQEKNREKLVQLQSLINTDKEIFINYPLYRDQLLQSLGGAVEQLQSTDPKALRKSIASQLTPTLTGMGSTLSQSEANNPRDDRYNLYQPNAPLSGQVESVLLIKESGNFKNTFSGATFYPHINNIRLSANSTQGITTYNVYRLLPTGYPLGSPIYKTTDPNDTQLAYYRGRHHPIEETTTGSTNGVSQPNLYGIPSTLLTNTISGDTKVGPVNLMVEGNGAYSPFINHAGIKIGLGIAAGKTTSFRLTGGQNFIDNKITAYTIPPGTVGYNPDGTSYPIQAGTFLYTDKGTRNYWTASGSTTLLGQQITGTTGIEQRVDDSDIQRTSLGIGPKNLANGGISFLGENVQGTKSLGYNRISLNYSSPQYGDVQYSAGPSLTMATTVPEGTIDTSGLSLTAGANYEGQDFTASLDGFAFKPKAGPLSLGITGGVDYKSSLANLVQGAPNYPVKDNTFTEEELMKLIALKMVKEHSDGYRFVSEEDFKKMLSAQEAGARNGDLTAKAEEAFYQSKIDQLIKDKNLNERQRGFIEAIDKNLPSVDRARIIAALLDRYNESRLRNIQVDASVNGTYSSQGILGNSFLGSATLQAKTELPLVEGLTFQAGVGGNIGTFGSLTSIPNYGFVGNIPFSSTSRLLVGAGADISGISAEAFFEKQLSPNWAVKVGTGIGFSHSDESQLSKTSVTLSPIEGLSLRFGSTVPGDNYNVIKFSIFNPLSWPKVFSSRTNPGENNRLENGEIIAKVGDKYHAYVPNTTAEDVVATTELQKQIVALASSAKHASVGVITRQKDKEDVFDKDQTLQKKILVTVFQELEPLLGSLAQNLTHLRTVFCNDKGLDGFSGNTLSISKKMLERLAKTLRNDPAYTDATATPESKQARMNALAKAFILKQANAYTPASNISALDLQGMADTVSSKTNIPEDERAQLNAAILELKDKNIDLKIDSPTFETILGNETQRKGFLRYIDHLCQKQVDTPIFNHVVFEIYTDKPSIDSLGSKYLKFKVSTEELTELGEVDFTKHKENPSLLKDVDKTLKKLEILNGKNLSIFLEKRAYNVIVKQVAPTSISLTVNAINNTTIPAQTFTLRYEKLNATDISPTIFIVDTTGKRIRLEELSQEKTNLVYQALLLVIQGGETIPSVLENILKSLAKNNSQFNATLVELRNDCQMNGNSAQVLALNAYIHDTRERTYIV